jgi:hypothetical protein
MDFLAMLEGVWQGTTRSTVTAITSEAAPLA